MKSITVNYVYLMYIISFLTYQEFVYAFLNIFYINKILTVLYQVNKQCFGVVFFQDVSKCSIKLTPRNDTHLHVHTESLIIVWKNDHPKKWSQSTMTLKFNFKKICFA